MYIWQHPDWPQFQWNEAALRPKLDAVRLLQGRLLGRTEPTPDQANLEIEMDSMIENAIRTSEIEGEFLDVGSVWSSVARQLEIETAGIAGKTTPESDSLVQLLLQATHQPEAPISKQTLCLWQAMLFSEDSDPVLQIRIGELRGDQPMQVVVSGQMDRPKSHFEAPSREGLKAELDGFISGSSVVQATILRRILTLCWE